MSEINEKLVNTPESEQSEYILEVKNKSKIQFIFDIT